MEKFTLKDCENKARTISEQFRLNIRITNAGDWKNCYENGNRLFSGKTYREVFNLLDAYQKGLRQFTN